MITCNSTYNPNIYLLIGIACLALTFVRFEPIQDRLKKLLTFPGKIWHLIYKVLSCPMCTGLWFGLALTQNILSASIISVLATYLSYITNRL